MMKPERGKTPRKKSRQTDPVEVFCRIRPINDPDEDRCVKLVNEKTVQISPYENSQAYRNGQYKEMQYGFNHVFDEYIGQKSLFDNVANPLVRDLIHGKNGLLFTYGITGSGKTFTMTGPPGDQGILPRCLDMIFNSIKDLQAKKYVFKPDKMNCFDVQTEADAMLERQKRDLLPGLMTPKTPKTPLPARVKRLASHTTSASSTSDEEQTRDKNYNNQPRMRDPSVVEDVEEDNNYAVFVSYIQIYNNYVYDLLEDLSYDPITGYKPPQSKILREDGMKNMYVNGCVEIEVKSTEEAFDVLLKGQKRRKVAHTCLNTESSRSHSVFNIRLVQAPLDPMGEEVLQDPTKVCLSQLSLVDLAGSERTKRTNSAGDRLKEAGSINQSLMVLRTCIDMLRENQLNGANKMVPFRDSKLTHLFKNYFDGEGKVRMIVCVNPRAAEYDETMHVMRFAEATQEVQVTRPERKHFDVGFTHGRRKMNKEYKEALAKMKDDGVPVPVVVPPALLYSLGAPFPNLKLYNASDESVMGPLIQFLKDREQKRKTLLLDLTKKQDQFRDMLVECDSEMSRLRHENEILKSELKYRGKDFSRLERKVKSMEQRNENLQRTAYQIEQDKQELATELDEQNQRIKREKEDKVRLKAVYKDKLVNANTQWQRDMERELRRRDDEAAAAMQAKERKLKMLKHIVNADTETGSSSEGSQVTPRLPRNRYGAKANPSRADYDMKSKSRTPGPPVAKKPSVTRTRSPPPSKSTPVVNPRHHRRSKSTGNERWLDHRPASNIELDTVLQPVMKKKKSVTQLNMKDAEKASKYMITHQELGSQGIETKLFKGDVMPTAGGGTAVIFNDVETLTQISPGDRKRRASQENVPPRNDGEWTDTETRCSTAIEGHAKRWRHV